MGFAEKIKDEKTVSLQLVRHANPDGSAFYAYIALMRANLKAFQEKVAAKDFDFSDIGVLIESGEGEPPEGRTEQILEAITKDGSDIASFMAAAQPNPPASTSDDNSSTA